jgi:hypothetical protein
MRDLAQWILRIVVASCAAVIGARALVGPLTWPAPVHSPLNAEGIFGLAAVLLVLLRAKPNEPVNEHPRRVFDWLDAVALTAIVALAGGVFWRAASFYFLSDDFVLLKHARSFWPGYRAILATAGGDGFYRPLTYLSSALTYVWAGSNPTEWHWVAIWLHVINTLLVFLLARAFGLSRLPAYFTSALFAVHGTRPEAVVWMAARADLLAAFFTLAALLSFIQSWNSSGARAVVYRCVALLSMMLGFLSKESSYTIPLLLAVFLASRASMRSRRAWYAILPFVVVWVGFLAWRWFLFGGIGGYLNPAGQPEALTFGLLPLLKTFGLRLWAILFFPINWSNQPGLLFGVTLIAYMAALLWLSQSRAPRRAILVLLAFLFLLALPPLQQLLIGPNLQKARLLYLPSVAFCLLLGAVAQSLAAKPQWGVVLAILVFNIGALFHNLTEWEQVSRKASNACAVAAWCVNGRSSRIAVIGLPPSVNGVYFFANGFPECVRMRNGDSGVVELREPDQPFDRRQFSCVLSWDPRTGELARMP